MRFSSFSANERVIPWWLFLVSCVVFIANLDFASNGDVYYYANIIDTLRFDQLTTHQGYYLLGFVAVELFGWAFGLPTDQGLTLMSALFGAGALSVGYLLLKHYLDSARDALIGTLMLFLCHRFFDNATSAEIYIVQTFFIWSSFLLFENRRFYTAGLSIALAIWVSPLTVAFGLWFPVVAYLRGFGVRSLVRLSIPVALFYLPFLFFFYEELLWGNRGLINEDQRRQMDLIEGGRNFLIYQFKHYSFLNLLMIPALFLLRREKGLLWISLAVALPNIYVISQLRIEDNVFILPLDLFFVCWFVIGWRAMREKSLAWAAAAVLAVHGLIFLFAEQPFVRDSHKSYGDEMRAIGRIVQDAGNAILFADWARRMAFVYFNRETTSYPMEQGYWYDMSIDTSYIAIHRSHKTNAETDDFANYSVVFVLDSWGISPQSQLFLDDATLRQRYEQLSQRREVERFLDVDCQPIHSGLYTLYKCR